MSDAGTGTVLRLEAPAPVRGLALVAGGTSVSALLVGMREARWSCADGRFLGEVTYRGPPPTAATIAPAGDPLAIATGDGGVRILDAATLETRSEMPPLPDSLVHSSPSLPTASCSRGSPAGDIWS